MTHQRRTDNQTAAALVTLTRREKQIMRLIAHGLSDKSIAWMLAISENTVNFHLKNIYRKLGVHNRTNATVIVASRVSISKL